MVEVFRTNVQNNIVAEDIIQDLRQLLPGSSINFDLEDCDRILRVEGQLISSQLIIGKLYEKGIDCTLLE